MATLAQLRILLGMNAAGVATGATVARKELRGVQAEARATDRAMGDLRKGFASGLGFGAGAGGFLVAAEGARVLTKALGDALEGAAKDEASNKRLGASLRANVADWDGNTAAIERGITARQKLGFADDEQRDAMARAVAATHDVAQANDILNTAADLARFKQIDLATATDALIKVEAGQFRMLKSLGIELRDGATQTEALAAVQAVAAGQAREFGETFDGALAGLGEELGELLEDGVKPLVPVLKDVVKEARGVIGVIPELAGQVSDLITEIERGGDPLADLLNFLANDLGKETRKAIINTEANALANRAAADSAVNYTNTLRELRDQLADGSITQQDYDAAVASATDRYAAAQQGVSDLQAATGDQAEENERARVAWDATRKAVDDAGKSLKEHLLKSESTVDALNLEETTVITATTAWMRYRGAVADANFQAKQIPINPALPPGTGDTDRAQSFSSGGDQAALDAHSAATAAERAAIRAREEAAKREGERRADEAAREAERKADEAEREAQRKADEAERERIRQRQYAMEDLFDSATEAARAHYQFVHDANVKAIEDIRDRRNAELDAQQAAIQGAVDTERARIQAIRDRERENELRAAVAAAKTPEDLAQAQRDLQRFLEDQRLDRLQANADTSIAGIDAERANVNAAADLAIANENERFRRETEAFNEAMGDLRTEISRHPEAYERVRVAIGKLVPGGAGLGVAAALQQPVVIVNNYLDGDQIASRTDVKTARMQAVYNPKPLHSGR